MAVGQLLHQRAGAGGGPGGPASTRQTASVPATISTSQGGQESVCRSLHTSSRNVAASSKRPSRASAAPSAGRTFGCPGAESNLTRASGVHARTLEHLDARGPADEVMASGARIERLSLFDSIRIDLSTLPTRFPFLLITPRYNVEQALERMATAAGVRIVRDAEVTGLRQDADGVELTVDGGALRADYAVGADGVNSSVRGALGLPFPGRSVPKSRRYVLLAPDSARS